MQSLCHVSTELWKQRASAMPTLDGGSTEEVDSMMVNMLYDSCAKGNSSVVAWVEDLCVSRII